MHNIHLRNILTEMCKRVGANYNSVDFKKEQWFMDFEWGREEEISFGDWFVNYLTNHVGARRELLHLTSAPLSLLRRAWNEFNFNYGWKYKEGTKI